MPQRLFQDLVSSRSARVRRGGRALPFSLAFHAVAVSAVVILPQLATELPPVAAAPPPPIPVWEPVRVAVVPTPPPPARVVARREVRSTAPATAAAQGHGPSLTTTDLSRLGEGDVTDDAPALCLTNCSGDATGSGDGLIAPNGSEVGMGTEAPPAIRRAGLDVTPPAKLGGSNPVYPELAKHARVEGEVVIECTIDPRGRVVDVVVTRSNPLFDASALDAVRTWRYRPTLVDGVPVPVLMTVTVRFRIK